MIRDAQKLRSGSGTLDKRLRNLFTNPFLGVCEVQKRNVIQEVVEAL
jgi:hypothetical protein